VTAEIPEPRGTGERDKAPPNDKVLIFHPSLPFSEGEGTAQFAAALSTGTRFGVLDLETAPAAGLPAFNDFFVETRNAALVPAAGEILLSGVRHPSEQGPAPLIQYHKGGEARIIEKTIEACSSFARDGVIIGHNLAGFDLPFLAVRAAAHGMPVPAWAVAGDRTLDTLRLYGGWGKFRTGMLSLQDTAALWGREPDVHSGASFGDLWRAGTSSQRDSLKHYNLLNLVDTVCLALHSGRLGLPEGTTSSPASPQEIWQPSEGYEFEPEMPSPLPPSRPAPPFFQWITAPLPGLMEHGPFRKAGWGRTSAPEAREDYPKGSGRLDASSVRVVGFVSSRNQVLDLESEAAAISLGLEEIEKLSASSGEVLTEAPHFAKGFICLRASVHGGILPAWFSSEKVLKEDRPSALGSDFLEAVALSCGVSDARIPSYAGAPIDEFLEAAWRVAAHRAFWGSTFPCR
jgi:hypothetical protein